MRTQSAPSHDALAVDVLEALSAGTHLPASWIEDKRAELAGRSRFEVLQWLARLEGFHLGLVAARFGVREADLRVTVKTVYRWY